MNENDSERVSGNGREKVRQQLKIEINRHYYNFISDFYIFLFRFVFSLEIKKKSLNYFDTFIAHCIHALHHTHRQKPEFLGVESESENGKQTKYSILRLAVIVSLSF